PWRFPRRGPPSPCWHPDGPPPVSILVKRCSTSSVAFALTRYGETTFAWIAAGRKLAKRACGRKRAPEGSREGANAQRWPEATASAQRGGECERAPPSEVRIG